MALNLTKNQKAIIDAVLAFIGFVLATLVANDAAFTGNPIRPYIGIIGAIGGYLVSDFATLVDTGAPPTVAVVKSQALESLKKARALPNLTDAEKSVLDVAIATLEASAKA